MTYNHYMEIYKSIERIIHRFQFEHYDYLKIGRLEKYSFDRIKDNPNQIPYYFLYGVCEDISCELLGHVWGESFENVMNSIDELLDLM